MKRILILASIAASCGGTGDVMITTYGEDYIEQMIPAAITAEEEGMVDGYTVRYSKFLLALSDLRVANRDGEIAADAPEQRIWDLTKAGPHEVVTFTEIPSGRWDRISIRSKPASGATAGNADAADVQRMNDGAWSVHVEGSANDGTESYSFAWSFDTSTLFDRCVDADEFEGVNVPTGGSVPVQFTIHGDHFFYDDLQSEEPSLRFSALAGADADADRTVTLEELALIDLTTLPAGQYGTGGDPEVNDLRAFVSALTRTLVHFQGEGHCVQIKQ